MVTVVERLRSHLGERVITDPSITSGYETDWTGRYRGDALCVVRPATTQEVSDVLAICSEKRANVVVQGGNTGLVGGSIPGAGDVVLSMRALDELGPVDSVAAQVTAGAGVTLARLQSHARQAGYDFGVDLAARGSATVGGMAATNAGGIRVIRFGGMRAQVAGAEAVLADGRILRQMDGLPKDSTGYDLTSLLVGSEGTLAVITALRLRLVEQLRERTVALVGLDGVPQALLLLKALRSLGTLAAAEIFFENGLDVVRRHTGLGRPVQPSSVYALFEVAGDKKDESEFLELLSAAEGICDAALGSDAPARERIWRYREAHTESISAAGVPIKLDIAVPLSRLSEFTSTLAELVRAVVPTANVVMFGHMNEGNIHVNVLDALEKADSVTAVVLERVAELGGSISAEHGIGRSKRGWLHLTRSDAEIASMRAIKRALDPQEVLGRGVLFSDQ